MKNNLKFIDLFAGIGGIRQGFSPFFGECVFSSKWDKFSQQTYQANFGEYPSGDITQITPKEAARLQGFPESFKIPVSDTQAYRQFGNSVAVP